MLKEKINNKYVRVVLTILLILIAFVGFSYLLDIINGIGKIVGTYLRTL